MIQNPELTRNVWTELTRHRLIITPVVLTAIVYLISQFASPENVSDFCFMLFIFFCYVWGTRSASDAICEEVNNHTWDWQRTSQLSPLQMTLGKLFGSTCFAWYAGALCLFLFAFRATQANQLNYPMEMFLGIVGAILTQSLALNLSFSSLQSKNKTKLKTFHYFLGGLLVGGWISYAHFVAVLTPFSKTITWHHMNFDTKWFFVGSLVLFCIWSMIGLYRNMRTSLQYRNIPWVYAIFVLYCMVYVSGFGSSIDFSKLPFNQSPKSFVLNLPVLFAFKIAIVLTYAALFIDKISKLHYQKMFAAFKYRSILKGLERFPCWPLGLALSIISGLWASTTSTVESSGLLSDSLNIKPHIFTLSSILLLVRDGFLFHYFKFSNQVKRTNLTIVFYLLVLYILIPSILAVLNLNQLVAAFIPSTGSNQGYAIIGPIVQIILLGFLTYNRWQKA